MICVVNTIGTTNYKVSKKRIQNLVRNFYDKLSLLVKNKDSIKRAQSRIAEKVNKNRKGLKFSHRRNGGKGKKTGIMYGINKSLEALKKAQSKRDKKAAQSLESIRSSLPARRSVTIVKVVHNLLQELCLTVSKRQKKKKKKVINFV